MRHFCDDPVCPDPVWKLSSDARHPAQRADVRKRSTDLRARYLARGSCLTGSTPKGRVPRESFACPFVYFSCLVVSSTEAPHIACRSRGQQNKSRPRFRTRHIQMTRSSGNPAYQGKTPVCSSGTEDASCQYAVPRAPDCGIFP